MDSTHARAAIIAQRKYSAHAGGPTDVISEIEQRCELEHVGFVIKETPEAVTISTEAPHDGRARNPFSIRRANIVEMHVRNHASAFRLKKS